MITYQIDQLAEQAKTWEEERALVLADHLTEYGYHFNKELFEKVKKAKNEINTSHRIGSGHNAQN